MQPQKHDYRQIKILPESLANQIAAGEVIERPSSVVKELIENSIYAGATQIIIEIQEGGKSLIRIRDNGKGIAQHDLALALATQYIQQVRFIPLMSLRLWLVWVFVERLWQVLLQLLN